MSKIITFFKNHQGYLLGLILIIGAFLRVVDITNNPIALYGDELTIAYDAYSILHTGQDQTGQSFPLTFTMGEGRPGGYVYATIPTVALFGPTALGVRLPSVISGVLAIWLVFLLGRQLFSKKIGLMAGLLMAISPWGISISRAGFEANLALMLAQAGVLALLNATKKPQLYIVAAALFGLTIHTYPTYKFVLPFFIILTGWYLGWRVVWRQGKKYLLVAALVLIGFALIAATQTLTANSEKRFLNINLLNQEEIRKLITHKAITYVQNNNLPSPISKLFHNKPVEFTYVLAENYLKNLSPTFLFTRGDEQPRHNMAVSGAFYGAEALLILMGLFLVYQKSRRIFFLLIFWILLVPIPTALLGNPHFLRNAFMLPPLAVLSAVGLSELLGQRLTKTKSVFAIFLLLLTVVQFGLFAERLYFLSPNNLSRFWDYPAKLASNIANDNRSQYEYIIISNRIDSVEYAYPVYSKVPPTEVISQNRNPRYFESFIDKKFGNVHIMSLPDSQIEPFLDKLSGSYLYIGSPWEINSIHDYRIVVGKDGLPGVLLKSRQ